MRTKKSWMLPASERADLGAFFSRLWQLMISYGSPPGPGDPDDDVYWDALIEACGRIGDKSDAEHNQMVRTLLLATLEGLERLQTMESGTSERSA